MLCGCCGRKWISCTTSKAVEIKLSECVDNNITITQRHQKEHKIIHETLTLLFLFE